MYYEVHGDGFPMVLIHGGAASTEMFSDVVGPLSRHRRVIAVDLQAHGRTADVDRPLRYETMAADIAALIEHLGLEQADVMGYSLGGGVALRTAIQHPGIVRKLVITSAPCRFEGWYPEVREAMIRRGPDVEEGLRQMPMYEVYQRVAPRPEDWPVLLAKLADLLARPYDWTADVARLSTATLVVAGDADSIRPSHLVQFFDALGGGRADAGWDGARRPLSRLAILPGTTHYDICSSPLLPEVVASFLGG
ncbi:MAG TPA: alpha/beta fold hydrolase [Thermoplasmata archaeon]|nr:alpha/beta fold hydrolase [Thermoplasmata archaeon]